ncbi:ShlB/FhaC/HecB family hemolysin secretion/activation protein [Bradyrhizobium sp.]|uniref:ShlB/FhaC/HecB family hemolysin secretion/activation protein n=1 Tax=Bradyrhizobium sp. TaxID=376 RepID=UPI003C2709BA
MPGPAAATAPQGAENLNVVIDDVEVDGAFPELSAATAAWVGQIRGRRISLAQIYADAAALERLHAEAGYPLARVVIPPQKLVDHGRLVVLVIDGFIEAIDLTGVPERAVDVVAARTDFLVGRRHVTIGEIERALLIAGDVPGLKLKSTLLRGGREGGVKLLLEGGHDLISGSLGGDDRLSKSLGTWQLRGSVAVNSAFGAGEQIYATAGLGADLRAAIDGTSPLVVYGGGVVIPIGADGITLNPEYTHSTTRTAEALGVPASLGTFERYALRLRDPLLLTRKTSLYLNVSLEEVSQQLAAPDFGVTLNSDRYAVLRAGPDTTMTLPWGESLQLGANLSQGLGGRTAAEAAASGVPLSRLGAGPEFTKLTANARLSQPMPYELRLDLIGAGQYSLGKPMMRPEQIALDGNDAVSAFASGSFTADQGVTLRGELSRPFAVSFNAVNAVLSPYLFSSYGRGWLADATSVEQSVINASAFGVGVRGNVEAKAGLPAASLGIELGRGYTDVAGIRQGWRANVTASALF